VITIATPADYIVVFVVAAVAGLVGGLASELLLTREEESGMFEAPHKTAKGNWDFGGFAALTIGAIVGVAILIVFPPETTIVTSGEGGTPTTTRGYDMVRLVATSIVAGSAGGSVLNSLQARLTAAVNAAQVQLTADQADKQMDIMRDTAAKEAENKIREALARTTAAAAPQSQPRGVGTGQLSTPQATPQVTADAAAEEAIASLRTSLDRQAEQGKAAIGAAAGRR
jgi:hypothetical protein